MDETQPKTLYVGNLDHSVSEDLLIALFSQMGTVKSCKIIREPGNDPYAFIEYITHQSAATALIAMNKRLFLEKEIKVNWATSPGNQPKTDTSAHHHIFVGDLSPEIETEQLREAFAPFGEISNCRIVRDSQTMKSKGYAFVSFVKKAEAENAIQAMNGQWLGSRSIRTNWSTRKPPLTREYSKSGGGSNIGNSGMGGGGSIKMNRATYEDVYNQSSPTNTTVYCGGFPANVISDELMQKHFLQFGPIQDIRVFKDKGFAFIKFLTKEPAAHAIEQTHNTEINGIPVKCFWGKENNGDNSMNNQAVVGVNLAGVAGGVGLGHGGVPTPQSIAVTGGQVISPQGAAQYPYAASAAAYQQMAYWYAPAGYPAAQMQTQYMQQGYYPYAAYTSAQQGAGVMNSKFIPAGYRMVQPNVAWGVPGAAVPTAATNGVTQPQMMYSAAMPQYQTQ
ncbi:nucleolysin TIAR isoform X2 [Condylostylus longicornis]|uniref:nucleolysin TIAR isoform X2 n=1 Tax=Condylostylus longicornis TaxID=2530218 RepID=UPI00244DD316|nr:nucleolysin TIAR isoform X2 [Condylostylus longicornis]